MNDSEIGAPPGAPEKPIESQRLEPIRTRVSRPPSVLKYGILFAILAALAALVPLAEMTYIRLFSEKTAVQAQLPEGRPLPAALVWSQTLYDTLVRLGTLNPGVELGVVVFISLIFVYCLLRILNPTFRLTTGVDWDQHVLAKTYMHSWPVTKAFLILVAAFLPAFIFWILLDWLLPFRALSLWLRFAALGAAAWLLFSRDGVAGDYEDGSYEPPPVAARRSLAIRGALAGTAAWLVLQFPLRTPTETLFAFELSLGYLGQAAWLWIAAVICGYAAVLGFGLGGIAVALGTPGRGTPGRLASAVVPAVVLALGLRAGSVSFPAYLADHDFPLPSPSAEAALAAKTGIAHAVPIPQEVLILGSDRAMPLHFSGRSTATGLSADPDSAARIDRYIRSKGARTSLNGPAFITMFDSACLNWNTAAALRVCLLNLRRAPDLAWQTHFMDILSSRGAAPSAEIAKLAGEMTDDSLFVYPDRQSWVVIGDVFADMADRAHALLCYRRANLPASQVTARADEKTAFSTGNVSGRILANGAPLAGARVGLIHQRWIGTVVRLPGEAPGLTNPFALSWIGASATTDSDGRFAFDHVIGGRYLLAVSVKPTETTGEVPIHNGPDVIAIDPSTPSTNLGNIDVRVATKGEVGGGR